MSRFRSTRGALFLKRSEDPATIRETRLKRLAGNIDALLERDAEAVRRAREITEIRRRAAAQIYGICAEFVEALNRLLSHGEIVLDPPEFEQSEFHTEAAQMIQINARGRILQVEFHAPVELVSTEEFRIPYTLDGAVRAFNQEWLDKNLIQEHLLFFTLEKAKVPDAPPGMWRFFDARTYRSGPFDEEYLVSLMERLL